MRKKKDERPVYKDKRKTINCLLCGVAITRYYRTVGTLEDHRCWKRGKQGNKSNV